MPTIKKRQAFTANQRIANVIQGDQFEWTDRPSNIKVYAVNDTTTNAGLCDLELFLSSRLVMANAPITSRAGRGIDVSTDLVCEANSDAGKRIVVGGVETTGAAADLELLVVVTPIA